MPATGECGRRQQYRLTRKWDAHTFSTDEERDDGVAISRDQVMEVK